MALRRIRGEPRDQRAKKRRWRRLSLQARITAGFALVTLVLCTVLTTVTFYAVKSSIVGQDVTSFENTAITNAKQVHAALLPGTNPVPILASIDGSSSSNSLLRYKNETGRYVWAADSEFLVPSELSQGLYQSTVIDGHASEQIVSRNNTPYLAVGIPIRNGFYFEEFSLAEAARILRILLETLVVVSVITILGGAVLGRWAARRVLRPLREVSQAALAIASGRLDTRIETDDEADLAVLASSFNQMADRLQLRIETDARFTSDVSHELRSPLTTLATALSVIEGRRDELPERSQRALDLLSAETRRFQQMVGDLLEISVFDAGSADFQPSIVTVAELVRNALASSGGAQLRVEMTKETGDAYIVVDKRRFGRIIANLIENADRHAGGATAVVVSSDDTNVRISIEDSGPGIAPEERERVFERFARGNLGAGSRGAGAGTGLGLALVQEHVKLHGGKVWVEEHETQGAAFIVEIPLAAQDLVDSVRAENEDEEGFAS